jgi:hypothetical protein
MADTNSSWRVHNDCTFNVLYWVTFTTGPVIYGPIIVNSGGNHECYGPLSLGTEYTAHATNLSTGVSASPLNFVFEAYDCYLEPSTVDPSGIVIFVGKLGSDAKEYVQIFDF